ncbi:unnamed protein product [Ophioblennius macclurei]
MKAVVFLYLLHATFPQASSEYGWNGTDSVIGTPEPTAVCSIDPNSCRCCAMMREVNETESHMVTVLTELRKQYECLKEKIDNLENNRVAFSACLYEEDKLLCEEPKPDNNIIKYKHALFNLGAAYSELTGIFTVPFSGVYSITVTVYSDSGASVIPLDACASLHVNGMEIAGARDRNKNDHEDSATIAVALRLDVGDEVSVRSTVGCLLCDDGRYNTFSAFLLHALD